MKRKSLNVPDCSAELQVISAPKYKELYVNLPENNVNEQVTGTSFRSLNSMKTWKPEMQTWSAKTSDRRKTLAATLSVMNCGVMFG